MLPESKAVLRVLRKTTEQLSIPELSQVSGLPALQVKQAVETLEAEGYVHIERRTIAVTSDINKEKYRCALSEKGRHPAMWKWEKIRHFLFHSILVPIIVSIVTAVATSMAVWYLTSLFEHQP